MLPFDCWQVRHVAFCDVSWQGAAWELLLSKCLHAQPLGEGGRSNMWCHSLLLQIGSTRLCPCPRDVVPMSPGRDINVPGM